jgi:hypothetical protein
LKTTIDEESTSYGRHYYGSVKEINDFETLLSLGLKAKAFVAK